MLVTLLGMVTLVKSWHGQNASDAIAVTVPSTPGIDEGIVMAHGGPAYPVMLMLLPLTPYMKPP
jgi:hypothetical protein